MSSEVLYELEREIVLSREEGMLEVLEYVHNVAEDRYLTWGEYTVVCKILEEFGYSKPKFRGSK